MDGKIHKLSITTLVDNVGREGLEGEWGLSILINADGHTILLDTGASGLFADNAQKLGIDLGRVEMGVLSHAHYDHSDGMEDFFMKNQTAPFYVRSGSRENCYGEDPDGSWRYIGIRRGIMSSHPERIRYAEGNKAIGEGMWLIPHKKRDYSAIALENGLYVQDKDERFPDDFSHEQSLVFENEKGLVIFNSCSHIGMRGIVEEVTRALDTKKVYAYIGGLHLFRLSDDEVRSLAREINDLGIERIMTGHCTGDAGFEILKEELGSGIEQFWSGYTASIV